MSRCLDPPAVMNCLSQTGCWRLRNVVTFLKLPASIEAGSSKRGSNLVSYSSAQSPTMKALSPF